MFPLLLSLLSAPASAADWSDFADAFPVLPCSDGWAGCIVGSDTITPEPVRSSDGVPTPSDQRLGWFNLDSQPAFDPFGRLSVYTQSPPAATPTPAIAPIPEPTPTTEPSPAIPRSTEPVPAQPVVKLAVPTTKLPEPPEPSPVARSGPASKVETCGTRQKLEPAAMLGRLAEADTSCLEEVAAGASTLTERSKASRILMAQAHASRDTQTWARLTKRHLDEIERSDPDIARSYAMHLARRGGDPGAVLLWSDVALENRHLWTGPKYVRNTLKLRALKAGVSHNHWKKLEGARADGQDVDEAVVQSWRTRTVTLAREWYDYAVSAGQPSDKALAVCIAAAGTEDACR